LDPGRLSAERQSEAAAAARNQNGGRSFSASLGGQRDGWRETVRKALVTAHGDGTVRLWDATTQREVNTVQAHGGEVWCVALSRDGRRLATGSSDGTVKLWDATKLREPGRGN
jgi:WD40 repeat protein